MVKRVALSWSGGKDSCLALEALVKQGVEVTCLITTVPAEIGRTFGHGEKTELITLQANSLSIPVEFIACSYENYTERYVSELKRLKDKFELTGIAYGDLYMDGHREWGEKVAAESGVKAVYPLWMKAKDSIEALETFVESGYKAKVIRVREDVLDSSWLGRELNTAFLRDIQNEAVCPMGESGEYHTFVYDGPLFSQKIQLASPKLIQLETTKKLEFGEYKLIAK
ncbi:diphthine--ammonia ligase [Bacillus sp. ISL-47]|uniref:Dph6-related ATP pyrophosphatase n=1 Tax=Bacillus sp. ISL-47 TaxID=2819130 RepID=UPI001BED2E10|nr:diphthine--ammonia ligase [Bacillus sp. ISL-47]MBT2689883.1 diphthine--ammonia ligase [Bacillus sp. ISL-47]MBT2710261.1 diphthine--ammonia ligase [Pseudomonas sp. ISL-84]